MKKYISIVLVSLLFLICNANAQKIEIPIPKGGKGKTIEHYENLDDANYCGKYSTPLLPAGDRGV